MSYSNDPDCIAALEPRLAALRDQGCDHDEIDDYARAFAADFAQGRADERERCAAIIMSPEAKGREAIAKRLALESDLTVEQALGVLATIPRTDGASSIAERARSTVVAGPWPPAA